MFLEDLLSEIKEKIENNETEEKIIETMREKIKAGIPFGLIEDILIHTYIKGWEERIKEDEKASPEDYLIAMDMDLYDCRRCSNKTRIATQYL